jgi:glycosyltransferase involved in cell wall biosynthesis
MKILLFSFSDNKGGAANASYSIYLGLKNLIKGIEFLCLDKKKKYTKLLSQNIYYTNFLRGFEKLLIIFFKKYYHQSLNIFNSFNLKKINSLNYSILNIHWFNRSSLSLSEALQLKNKVAFSLHDMWFVNASSHYSKNFEKKKNFIEKYIINTKKKIFLKKNFFFIVHTKWLYNILKKKFKFKKNKVFLCKHYPVDTDLFKPRNKEVLRKKYNIPLDKIVIVFSSQNINDPRKGFIFYEKIMSVLQKNFFFISIGSGYVKNNLHYSKNYKNLNFINHNSISEIYSLSDIYLCLSSLDNLPLTVLEAMSSGLCVISFDNGGVSEVLKNKGYLVKNKNYHKIISILKNINSKTILSKSRLSRNFALKNFKIRLISQKYFKIFEQINKINVS